MRLLIIARPVLTKFRILTSLTSQNWNLTYEPSTPRLAAARGQSQIQ
jgi:hypothetical protein